MSSVWPIERAGVDPLYRLGHPQVQLVASRQGEAADQGLADELMGDDEAGSGSSLAAAMRWARSASSIPSTRAFEVRERQILLQLHAVPAPTLVMAQGLSRSGPPNWYPQ